MSGHASVLVHSPLRFVASHPVQSAGRSQPEACHGMCDSRAYSKASVQIGPNVPKSSVHAMGKPGWLGDWGLAILPSASLGDQRGFATLFLTEQMHLSWQFCWQTALEIYTRGTCPIL